MTSKIRSVDAAGVARTWTNVRAVNASSVVKGASLIRVVKANGALATVYDGSGGGGSGGGFILYASPKSVGGGGKTGNITTVSVTVSVSGGTPPYTIAWSLVDFNNATSVTAVSPSSFTTAFRATGVDPGVTGDGTYRGTVTDSASLTDSIDVKSFFVRDF